MEIEKPISEARLLRRYKRFLADVELTDGEVITVHCPNPGRLEGCQEAGARVILRDSQDPARKLRFTLQTIEVANTWVNVDTLLPNGVVAEAIEAGRIPELTGYDGLRREVSYGEKSRIDLLLESADRGRCYVEVKTTTLARGSVAMFPDAPTVRGRKHLEELERVVRDGERAVMLYFVSRGDVDSFRPADDVDPEYGRLLRRVVETGVEALAYRALVEPDRMEVTDPIEVQL